MVLFLFSLILERKGFFINEPTQAKDCNPFTEFSSAEKKVHVIELYTSEGCSSCPPAEKWLNSLYDHEELFQKFVPLAFHVDYWDYIGHKDKFGKKEFNQRQRKYSQKWGKRTVYTPGFVLDGKEWHSLKRTPPSSLGKKVGVLKVKKKESQYLVTFSAIDSSVREFKYHFTSLALGLKNHIKRGENAGKTLKHYFVVDEHQVKTGGKEGVSFSLSPQKVNSPQRALAVWVSVGDDPTPIQATGHCL